MAPIAGWRWDGLGIWREIPRQKTSLLNRRVALASTSRTRSNVVRRGTSDKNLALTVHLTGPILPVSIQQ